MMSATRRRWSLGALLVLSALAGCATTEEDAVEGPFVIVLGVAQDGGYPQAGCAKECCRRAWEDPARRRHVASLAIVDPVGGRRWLVDATPDLREQLRLLDEAAPPASGPGLDGVFLTHAHIGHYAGLVHLGREVMGTSGIPLYALPRMGSFLASSGPWDQLLRLGNVEPRALEPGRPVELGPGLSITPILVPHRDEYSETAAFRIRGPRASVLYLPDIDKWVRWDRSVEEEVAAVDVAYLDGTFHDEDELPGRDMSEIPHPFVVETLARMASRPAGERERIRFLHLNHTNPLLDPRGEARRRVEAAGLRVAEQGEKVPL